MEELIGGPFARALDAGRPRYNALFAQARQASPRLDPDVFAAFLRGTVAPVVDAVAPVAPDRVQAVVDALYEAALDLVACDVVARHPVVAEGWLRVLAGLPRQLAAAPGLLTASVSNALYNLSSEAGARPREWIESMRALGERCPETGTLLDAGKVAAWRAGMAHFREGALDACARLEPPVACAALGIADAGGNPPVAEVLARLRADPWIRPEEVLRPPARQPELDVVARVGGFRGFGGQFLRRPTVSSSGGVLYATDGEGCWCLMADAFGATLHRAGDTPPAPDPGPEPHFSVSRAGKVTRGKHSATFGGLEGWSSLATNGSTLAATIPLSYLVFLIALR